MNNVTAVRATGTGSALGAVRTLGAVGALLFLASLLILNTVPGGGPVDQVALEQFYVGDGAIWLGLVGAFLIALSAMALLAFVWGVYNTISTPLAQLGFVSAALGVALFTVGGGLIAAPGAAQLIGGASFVGVQVAHAIAGAGWAIMLIGGSWFLALGVAAIAFAARRTGSLPRWVSTAGLITAMLQIGAAFFFPVLVMPIWLLLASLSGFRVEGHR